MKKNSLLKGLFLIPIALVVSISLKAAGPEVTFNVHTYNNGYNISCNGAHDGSIEAVIISPTTAYSFVWTNGSFTSYSKNISGLSAGTYTITVTDANSMTCSGTVTLSEPDALDLEVTAHEHAGNFNVSCQGCNDGIITTYIHGGSPSYSYLWSDNSDGDELSDLVAGTYSVTVTDANGCTVSQSATLIAPTPLHITGITSPLYNGYNVSCHGGENGSINLSVTGGVTPYTYAWSNGNATEDISNLSAINYSVIVTDAAGAKIGGNLTLTQPAVFAVAITPHVYSNGSNLTCYDCTNGIINATVSGGVTPYTYTWTNTSQTSATISNLPRNNYGVIVTDANGCTISSGDKNIDAPERDDWSMDGNAGTTPGTQFIGTTDNKDFVVKTNNIERMRFESGDTLVLKDLTYVDKLKVQRIASQDSLIFFGEHTMIFNQVSNTLYADPYGVKGVGLGEYIQVDGLKSCAIGYYSSVEGSYSISVGRNNLNKGTSSITIGRHVGISNSSTQNAIVIGSGAISSNQFLYNNIDNSLAIGFNSTIPTLFVSPAATATTSGNVGIGGTTSPQARLQVDIDENDTYGGIMINKLSSATSHSEVKFMQNGVEHWAIGSDLGQTGRNNFFFWNHDLSRSVLTLSHDGAVGINCDPGQITGRNTDFKLYVEGSIAAREIKVTINNFPDYVFDDEYKLISLYDLKTFINKNHHLPEFLPADEIKKDGGVEIGKLQTKIIKTVEEQSLYIISLQEQIDELKNEIKNLER